MPEAMQAIGSEMHRSASRFALEAENASVTGDVKPALAALSKVTQQCVACHSAYRVQ
jgi:cytochrome c556